MRFIHRYRAKNVLSALVFFALSTLPPYSADAASSSTFTARGTFAVCPEYRFGGISIIALYRLEGTTQFLPAQIVREQPAGDGTAQVDFLLPNSAGPRAIEVVLVCNGKSGTGDTSNTLSISNCDALAVIDSDGDGLNDNEEDKNCNNSFDDSDNSNPFTLDTDGDSVSDHRELLLGANGRSPLSSPSPTIVSGQPFDPDGNGDANAVSWTPTTGVWTIEPQNGPRSPFAFGGSGDLPFTYRPAGAPSDVGVIRTIGGSYTWLFHGPGFLRSDGSAVTSLVFGQSGDLVIPGPWEIAGITSPAIARLRDGEWSFNVFHRDGSTSVTTWGGNGDVPLPQDYDGDGRFDAAVYRPTTGEFLIRRSSDGGETVRSFEPIRDGILSRGDLNGDGAGDITCWNHDTTRMQSFFSTGNFDAAAAAAKNPNSYREFTIGSSSLFPVSWNRRGGKAVFTLIDPATGTRRYFAGNDPSAGLSTITLGTAGDFQG